MISVVRIAFQISGLEESLEMGFFSVFLTLSATCLVVFLLYVFLEKRRLNKLVGHLNKFPEHPFIGGIMAFIGKDPEEITKYAVKLLEEVELPATVFVGPLKMIVFIDDPEDLEILLSDPNAMAKPYMYKFFKNDRGLVAAPVNIWRLHRKILSPSFGLNVIKTLIPIFNQKVQVMVSNLAKQVEGANINILEHMYSCVLDLITTTLTDVDIDVQEGKNQDYLEAVKTASSVVATRVAKTIYHIDWIFNWSEMYRIQMKSLAKIHNFFDRIIKMKREMFDEVEDAEEERREEQALLNNEEIEQKPKIVINQLFRYWVKGQIGFRDVRGELDVMLYSASDTTTNLASYTLLMLAMHPEVQAKAIAELKEVFVNDNVSIDYNSVKQLQYLDMVIKETLRLYPVIPYIGREVSQDVKLKNLTVPAGTAVGIPILWINRNPKTWGPKAHLFNPDNFLPEKVAKRHPYQYLAFSGGPRNCIGMTYGLIAARTIVACVLMNFRLSTTLKFDDIRMVFNITLRIINENFIQLERRTDFFSH
ncbi:cytochrome P450 4C1-like [Phlebotomus argentipes]|uniref:cytochrome P450 4C1-like n=1 Tax=Phlebotomus argentipes TaxID=94469 RepID=UPI0028932C44|nr:cytochrome P450 4C1-like [Phlebotomus argentipes]